MLWLWHRLAAAAPIRPLAWELPYAVGAALKKKKKENKRNYTMGNYNAEMFTNLLSPRVRGQRKRKIIGLSLEGAITQ